MEGDDYTEYHKSISNKNLEWNGYDIMQNEKFMEIYCKNKGLDLLKIDGTIAYLHKFHILGYTFMKIHSPSLANISRIIHCSERKSKDIGVPLLIIISPYSDEKLTRYQIKSDGTLIVNLTYDKDKLWDNLNKKTRNEIRQAKLRGTVIKCTRDPEDFEAWWEIYLKTSKSKKFAMEPHDLAYEAFTNPDISRLFVSKIEERIISGALLLINSAPLYWLGATDLSFSKYRPNNLLHWEIINWAKDEGFTYYDMGGAIINKHHGPTRFKEGFGGDYREFYIYYIPIKYKKCKLINLFLKLNEAFHKL